MKVVVDRYVETPNRYKLTNADTGEELGTFDFDEVTGSVVEEGTVVDAELLNGYKTAIEEEIARAKLAEQTNATAIQTEATQRDEAVTAEKNRAQGEEAKKVNISGGEIKDTVVTFTDTEVTTDDNVKSGEKSSVLWAKVKRWFGRLKALAFKATVGTGDIDAKAVTSAKLDDSVNSALNAANSAIQREDLADIATSGNLSDGVQDANNRLVTDTEKTKWNNAANNMPTKTSNLTNDGEDGTSKYATQKWVNDQNFSNLADGSVTRAKLDSNLQSSIDKANSALQSSIFSVSSDGLTLTIKW